MAETVIKGQTICSVFGSRILRRRRPISLRREGEDNNNNNIMDEAEEVADEAEGILVIIALSNIINARIVAPRKIAPRRGARLRRPCFICTRPPITPFRFREDRTTDRNSISSSKRTALKDPIIPCLGPASDW